MAKWMRFLRIITIDPYNENGNYRKIQASFSNLNDANQFSVPIDSSWMILDLFKDLHSNRIVASGNG